MSEPAKSSVNERIERTTIIAVYSAFVAACYLASFWSRFDVNIFQFAGLTGFASLAVLPLMSAFGVNVFVLFIVSSRPKAIPHRTQMSVCRKIAFVGLTAWTVLGPPSALLIYFMMDNAIKWVLILIVMLPFIHKVEARPIFKDLGVDLRRKTDIVYWAFAFPVLAGMAGQLNAQAILDGREDRVVALTGAAKNLQADADHPVAFLGFAGGTYFLYESKSGNVVMVNQAVAEPLTFLPHASKTHAASRPN